MTKAYINLCDENGKSIGAIELEPREVVGLPDSGKRRGELVFNLLDSEVYYWDGSRWVSLLKHWFFNVRREVLAEFTNPKLLIATSSMNSLYNSADKVITGSISANSKELTIVGGTATSTGNTWIYWNLPEDAKKAYMRASINSVNARTANLELCYGDAGDLFYPLQFYCVVTCIPLSAEDFSLRKYADTTVTILAVESVDLSYDTYYDVEFYYKGDGMGNNKLKVWRDGVLKFDIDDVAATIPYVSSVRIRVYDDSDVEEQSGKVKDNVVVIYE